MLKVLVILFYGTGTFLTALDGVQLLVFYDKEVWGACVKMVMAIGREVKTAMCLHGGRRRGEFVTAYGTHMV